MRVELKTNIIWYNRNEPLASLTPIIVIFKEFELSLTVNF